MNDKTSQTRFWHQLRSYGLKRFMVSLDFLIGCAVFVAIFLDQKFVLDIFSSPNDSYVITIFAAASTLFAITLAALAILLSFSSSEFVAFLRKYNMLNKLLFIFWSGNAAYLSVISLSIIYLLLNSSIFGLFKTIILYPIITAIFIYALIDTFYILGTVIRFGHFLDLYENFKNQNKEN